MSNTEKWLQVCGNRKTHICKHIESGKCKACIACDVCEYYSAGSALQSEKRVYIPDIYNYVFYGGMPYRKK